MNNYNYKCFNCASQFSAIEIEKNFHYLSPKCGIAKKNEPLTGVLLIGSVKLIGSPRRPNELLYRDL